MKKYTIPRITLGGTSFLLPADYVPAMRFAAECCEDVALLLLETGEHGEYFATRDDLDEIARIIDGEGTSLHVHLPTDANFDTPQNARALAAKVREAVDRTARLRPHSFVLHVDFPSLYEASPDGIAKGGPTAEQRQWTAETLAEIAARLPEPGQLAIENLEAYPTSFCDGWLDGTPYSRCLDIGHIWKVGGDPAPVLADWLPRVRVIHLHGLAPRDAPPLRPGPVVSGGVPGTGGVHGNGGHRGRWPRDHKSLRFMPAEAIDAVMHPLWDRGFTGVLNLEVFNFDDFTASHAALLQSWERYPRA